jgi:hypothetical protein
MAEHDRCRQTAPRQSPDHTLPAKAEGRVVSRRVDELRPHPSFIRHQLVAPVAKLTAAASHPANSLRTPLVTTHEQVILDGYAEWDLARVQGRPTVSCIEYELGEEEALRWLLRNHLRSNGLNNFSRILLALDLEPSLQGKAQSNQRAGGQNKDSSTLTEAVKVDVRAEIATAAGVSTGNVTKAKQLIAAASPDLLQAVRLGEISIHRAWLWSKEPSHQQRKLLLNHQGEKGVRKAIRQLVSNHRPKARSVVLTPGDLAQYLQEFEPSNSLVVAVVQVSGKGIFITEELFRALKSQQELSLECATNNR